MPPTEMAEYIGEKPEPARLAQSTAHQEAAAGPPKTPWRLVRPLQEQRQWEKHQRTRAAMADVRATEECPN